MVEKKSQKGKKQKPIIQQEEPKQRAIQIKDNLIFINLTVKPNSKQDCVQELDSESLSICVASEAKNGEANTNVVELIADMFKVKKYQVDLVRGHKSHDKVV